MNATARFGFVTLARRAEPPALRIVRKLVAELMSDPVHGSGGSADGNRLVADHDA
jgi:hypothetical protein